MEENYNKPTIMKKKIYDSFNEYRIYKMRKKIKDEKKIFWSVCNIF